MQVARNLVLFALAAGLAGCADPGQRTGSFPHRAEAQRVWKAMHTVLSRHFNVREDRYAGDYQPHANLYRGDALVGVSKIHSDGFQKYRFKVIGRVYQDDEDFYQSHVRVIQQIDVSSPRVMSRAVAQPRYQWRNVGFHDGMEARLRNAIDAELHGRENPYDGRFFRDELPRKPQKGAKGGPDLSPAGY